MQLFFNPYIQFGIILMALKLEIRLDFNVIEKMVSDLVLIELLCLLYKFLERKSSIFAFNN